MNRMVRLPGGTTAASRCRYSFRAICARLRVDAQTRTESLIQTDLVQRQRLIQILEQPLRGGPIEGLQLFIHPHQG